MRNPRNEPVAGSSPAQAGAQVAQAELGRAFPADRIPVAFFRSIPTPSHAPV